MCAAKLKQVQFLAWWSVTCFAVHLHPLIAQQFEPEMVALREEPYFRNRFSAVEIKPLLTDPLAENIPIKLATAATQPKNGIGSPEMIRWLTELIHENLPPTYEDNRRWNLQREVLSGLHIELDGLKLNTHRNRKLVNAGPSPRYAISFIEPDKNLIVAFQKLEPLEGAKVAFETTVVAPLDIRGQLAEWARDVKLYSFSAHATSTVKLTLAGTVQFQLNMLKLPPDITVKPVIEQAHVQVSDFEVHRISRLGGDAAELLGKGMRKVVDEKIEDMNRTLVVKINSKLQKRSEKFSFSTQDWVMSKLPLPSATESAQQP